MSSISSIVFAQQLNFLTNKKANPLHAIEAQIAAISPPNASDRTTISDAARDIFSSNPNASSAAGNDGTVAFDTNEGSKSIDISDYFHLPVAGMVNRFPSLRCYCRLRGILMH